MFDLRYHVASLAAVFLALTIGIILGVAISGKVKGAESSITASELNRVRSELQAERDAALSDRERLADFDAYVDLTYAPLMENRLAGKSFALVFLGPVDAGIRGSVSRALQDAGAGAPARLVAFDLPLDPTGLDQFLQSRDSLARYRGANYDSLGRELGAELLDGEVPEPVLPQVSSILVEERAGSMAAAVDGAVIVRSWLPGDATKAVADSTETLVGGVISGLQGGGVPVVGVTASQTTNRKRVLGDYSNAGVSSVNDIDLASGRLALALLLQGAEGGAYGFGQDTDGPIPPVPAVTSVP
jgi:hypothetical protein